MPLEKSVLQDELEKIFRGEGGYPATAVAAAEKWAAAYRLYASGAKSCGVPGLPVPGSLEAKEPALATALASGFSANNPATAAAAWSTGLTAFWTAVPFTGVTPGASAPPTGAAALPGLLTAMWLRSSGDKWTIGQAASETASLLHTTTKTVVVTHAPPSACALPIS